MGPLFYVSKETISNSSRRKYRINQRTSRDVIIFHQRLNVLNTPTSYLSSFPHEQQTEEGKIEGYFVNEKSSSWKNIDGLKMQWKKWAIESKIKGHCNRPRYIVDDIEGHNSIEDFYCQCLFIYQRDHNVGNLSNTVKPPDSAVY